MGRTLKRVPLDFAWPLGKVWGGYLNPWNEHMAQCSACSGTGLNAETKRINDEFYDFDRTGRRWVDNLTQDEVDALVAQGRLAEFTHHIELKKGWVPNDPPTHPTAEQVNAWSRGPGMGHDAINRWILVKARAKRLGVYGECPGCGGEGSIWSSEESRLAAEAWQEHEPPTGPGFQLWETTTEGSPKSPVFETLDELCAWCADNATTFGNNRASAEEWRSMLDEDLVHHREGNHVFI